MTDRMTKKQRSRTMSHIRGRDTEPELILRRKLWRQGIRFYRTHLKGVIGTPDIAFPGLKVAVFVDGCFWHGCPKCYREPSSNTNFWRQKVSRNAERDRRVNDSLMKQGWSIFRVWEHDVRTTPDAVAQEIVALLKKS